MVGGSLLEPAVSTTEGKWLYPLLVILETIGADRLASTPDLSRGDGGSTGYSFDGTAFGAGIVIQLAYWIGCRVHATTPPFVNAPLGHIVLFAARLTFLLPTSIFSFLFNRFKVQLSTASRYMIIVFGLFSLFCYIRELEHVSNSLLGKPAR